MIKFKRLSIATDSVLILKSWALLGQMVIAEINNVNRVFIGSVFKDYSKLNTNGREKNDE